jgi:hypothetical protein
MAALRACTKNKKNSTAKAAKRAKKKTDIFSHKKIQPERLNLRNRSGIYKATSSVFSKAFDLNCLARLAHPSSGYRKEALAAQCLLGFVLVF